MHALIFAFIFYFVVLIVIGLLASKKQKTAGDFMLGGRGLNYWVTAISTNAADMSAWLFMGLPAVMYTQGMTSFWTAIGLVVFMFLNWHFVAPKLRVLSEAYQALTLSSFFEKRFNDTTGTLRTIAAVASIVFLVPYVASGLQGLGYLFESIFGMNYYLGCLLGISGVVLYTYIGGFTAIAWTDFFQGMFLLLIVLVVPFIGVYYIGGFDVVEQAAANRNLSLSIFPDYSATTLLGIINISIGWGLGYFGQPHILSKFMAIDNPAELTKSKYLSTAWQILALSSAAAVGIVALAFFDSHHNPQLIFVDMVKTLFTPFLAGLVLCGFMAATLSTIDSQILVLASVFGEDLYKKTLHINASNKQVVWVTRLSVVMFSLLALVIASYRSKTIFELVNFCWCGLGSAFGPLMLMCLSKQNVTRLGAICGMLTGACIGAFWGFLNTGYSAMIPGFILSTAVIYIVSKLDDKRN